MSEPIEPARLHPVASDRTGWLFVELALESDLAGRGEASLEGHQSSIDGATRDVLPRLVGRRPTGPERITSGLPFGTPPQAAVSSAVSQAFRAPVDTPTEVPLTAGGLNS